MGIVGSLWYAAKGIALDPILECNGESQISSESSSFVASARREAFINVRGASVGGTHKHTHTHMYTTDWLHVKRTHTNALIFIEQKHNQSIGFMCSNSR